MVWNVLEYFQPYQFRNAYASPCFYDILTVDYALAGAYPMRRFVPGRHTFILDLIIAYDDRGRALQEIAPHVEYTDYFSDTHSFFVHRETKIYFSLIFTKAPWTQQALTEAQDLIHPVILEPLLPFSWIILSKLYRAKPQDFMDCARLIARADPVEIESTKVLLEEWYPEYLPELRELYKVGTEELRRAPSGEPVYINNKTQFSPFHHLNAWYLEHQDDDISDILRFRENIEFPDDWMESKYPYVYNYPIS